jgi:hypothetical protein
MDIIQFTKDLFHQPAFIGFLAIITTACFYYLNSRNQHYKKIIWIAYSSIFTITFFIFFSSAYIRFLNPQVWDFTAFYLYGKVAASGYNYYSPENFLTVFNSIDIPFHSSELGGFIATVVNVGFPYPPPTILYFMPLGFLSFKTALGVWTIFNLIIVFGCLFLIYDLFLKEYKLNGIFLTSILFFILGPSLSTVSFSQTNFILLFLLLLMKKYSEKNVSGLFLALAFFTKPYMAIFGLFFLLQMNWKTILYCIISTIVIIALTLIIVGKEPFISFFVDNPTNRIPMRMYYEGINQSLHSVLLRSNIISLNTPLIYLYIVAGFFFCTVLYIFYLMKRKFYDHIWVLLLLIGLLLYPGTLNYYGTLLLFIIFQFFDEKKQLGFEKYLSIPIIGIFYFLSTISLFATIWFLLVVIILKAVTFIPKKSLDFNKNLQQQY